MSVAGFALAGQAAAQEKPKTAGEVFKNVTTSTLKGLTVDEFMGSMGVMAAALGWDCADCHEGAGTDKVVWEADTPRKVMARKMTEMVAVINKTNFGGAPMVSCWTCHHGRDIPATSIALDTSLRRSPTTSGTTSFRKTRSPRLAPSRFSTNIFRRWAAHRNWPGSPALSRPERKKATWM
jgi:hypothetical protein